MSLSSLRSPNKSELTSLTYWRLSTFWVCLLGYIGYYICRKNLSVAVPLLSENFGFSNSQLGLIALYSEMAYALGKFINGPLGDKIGGKKIFLLGMLGAIVANLAFSQGTEIGYFIIIWCICRYFLSMGWGGLAKVIGNWYEPERNGTIMGFISLNFQFGGVVATLFAGLIISLGGTWQDIFIYPPLVLFIIFIWSFLASKDSPQDIVKGTNFGQGNRLSIMEQEKRHSKTSVLIGIKNLVSMHLFRILLLYSFLTTFLRSIFFFWTPKLLVDLGFQASNAAFKSALFPLLGCAGTIFLGWYTDRYAKDGNRAKMMWIMLGGLVVSLFAIAFCIPFSNSTVYSSIIVFLIGLCGFFLLGPYSMTSGCLTLDIAGSKSAGSATGMLDGLGYVGGSLAVWIAGFISDQLGWVQVFLILASVSILAMLCALYMSWTFKNRNSS